MRPHNPTPRGALLAVALGALLATHGCVITQSLAALPGAPDFASPGRVPVPGGTVDAAGGNLMLRRRDLSLDTALGTVAVEATWNSATGRWLWSHQIRYDGLRFTAADGAVYEVGQLADGASIPGSIWVRVDASTLRTQGGLAYHFDASGALDHVRWATLDYPRLAYEPTEIALCVAPGACTSLFWIAPGPGGQPAAITDARTGRSADYAYDALGRLVTARDARTVEQDGPGVRYEYGATGTLLTAIVNGEGERVEYSYQAGRRIRDVVQVGAGDPAHHFAFGAKTDGLHPTLHTNPLGGRTRYGFDPQRRLRQVERVDTGELETIEWEGLRPARRVSAAGVETRSVYADDRLVSRHEPSGNVVAYTYETGALNLEDPRSAPLRRVEDALGLVEARTYDGLGRLASIANGAGETTAFAYHGSGVALAARTDPAGLSDAFPAWGAHGHWLEREGPRPDRRAFDAVGNPTVASAVGERGGILTWQHDAGRGVRSVSLAATDAEGAIASTDVVTITRRSDGQVTEVLRPGGGDHALVYDALGRVVEQRERVDGAWRVTVFEYDRAGHPTARTRPNGMREEFAYDVYGRLVAHRALRDGDLEGERLLTWQDGRVVSSYDSIRNSTELYAYDGAGRLAWVFYGYGESATREYDARSRLVAEGFALPTSGTVVEVGYEYDLADRPVRLIDRLADELLVERSFAAGRLVATAYGNGLTRTRSYDAEGRLVGLETSDALGARLETTELSYQVGVDPLHQTIRSETITPLAATDEEYSLQLGGSLASPEQFMGKRVFRWRGGGASERFAYDALGNRVDDPSGNTFVYNAERNRLLWASLAGVDVDYSYDEAGFVTSRAGVPITWTATGRMASHGSDRIQWDMQGRVVALTLQGVERRFDLFGGRIESDAAGGVLGPLDLGAVAIGPSGGRRYRHPDFRSHVGFATDASGAVVAHYHYGAYGVHARHAIDDDGVTWDGNPEIGGLVLAGARVYDSAVGRFLSADPVLGLTNQYTYTSGNPVFFMDAGGASETTRAEVNANVQVAANVLFLVGTIATVAAPPVGVYFLIAAGSAQLYVSIDAIAPVPSLCSPLALGDPATGTRFLPYLIALQLPLLGAWLVRQRSRDRRHREGAST